SVEQLATSASISNASERERKDKRLENMVKTRVEQGAHLSIVHDKASGLMAANVANDELWAFVGCEKQAPDILTHHAEQNELGSGEKQQTGCHKSPSSRRTAS